MKANASTSAQKKANCVHLINHITDVAVIFTVLFSEDTARKSLIRTLAEKKANNAYLVMLLDVVMDLSVLFSQNNARK